MQLSLVREVRTSSSPTIAADVVMRVPGGEAVQKKKDIEKRVGPREGWNAMAVHMR